MATSSEIPTALAGMTWRALPVPPLDEWAVSGESISMIEDGHLSTQTLAPGAGKYLSCTSSGTAWCPAKEPCIWNTLVVCKEGVLRVQAYVDGLYPGQRLTGPVHTIVPEHGMCKIGLNEAVAKFPIHGAGVLFYNVSGQPAKGAVVRGGFVLGEKSDLPVASQMHPAGVAPDDTKSLLFGRIAAMEDRLNNIANHGARARALNPALTTARAR